MFWLLSLSMLVGGAPPAAADELWKTFRQEFVAITPGEGEFPADFLMGDNSGPDSERPARRVRLTNRFEIARYEVPQNLWQAAMGTNPSRWKGDRNAVEMLSFDDALEFCRRATELMRAKGLITAGEEIRLPSEAEWEYAARAGTTTRYSFGDDTAELDQYAWHTGNAAGNDPPVGAKKPNPWGLYDVHGYLWEWCADTWRDDYRDAASDAAPRADGNKDERVLRGGSWKDAAPLLTSTYRRKAARDLADDAVGLRCVLAPVR